MNDDLDKLLKSAPVPDRSAGYWEHFPKRVLAGIGGSDSVVAAPSRHAWAWAIGCAAVGVVIIFSLWVKPQRKSPTDYAKLYREISSMFPHQVRAIVEDQRGVHLVLAETPDVPSSPPLLVRVCEPQQCRSVITFSGQRVRLDGQTVEVLADGNGDVLVVGERSIVRPTEARAL